MSTNYKIHMPIFAAMLFLGVASFATTIPETPAPPASAGQTFKRGVNISHWLAQNRDDRPYGAAWFSEEDVKWIADAGFDHLRIPVDARLWMREDGSLNESVLEPFDKACAWAQRHTLGVILDMHTLPGANFSSKGRDSTLFTDNSLMKQAVRFWGEVAAHYASAGPWLRFELINEPVAEKNAQLNRAQVRLLAAIRKTNPKRVVYLTSNQWSKIRTLPDLELPDDPNIALTVHFYDPFPFTHQRTDWTEYKPSMPQVDFPGVIPDLSELLPPGHSRLELSNQPISAERSVDPEFKILADWAKKNAPDLEVHIGEFGAYSSATSKSIHNYYAAVVTAAERHGFGWCAWDYQGGFAVRAPDGSATAAMHGIEEGITPHPGK